MDMKTIIENFDEVTWNTTDETNEMLHMILDLKQGKEVDLYQMQTTVLHMYKDQIQLLCMIHELHKELEMRKKRKIEIPKFMSKEEKAQ